MLQVLLPASGRDLEQIVRVDSVGEAERVGALEECMSAFGFDQSFSVERPPGLVPRRFEFPHLASIATHGINNSLVPDIRSEGELILDSIAIVAGEAVGLPQDMTLGEAEAFPAAHRDCQSALDEAAHTSEVFIDQFDLLHSRWMGHVVDLDRDPTYQALLDEAVACLVARGWKTDSYEGFFSTVDGQISRAAPDLEAMRQISHGAGRDFSDCLATWDVTRTTQLETDRAAFVDDNFAALVEAEAVFRQFFGDGPP